MEAQPEVDAQVSVEMVAASTEVARGVAVWEVVVVVVASVVEEMEEGAQAVEGSAWEVLVLDLLAARLGTDTEAVV